MKELRFLAIGKNLPILETLKRIIESNSGWSAVTQSDEESSYEYLINYEVDIVLLSSGLNEQVERRIKKYVLGLDKSIKIIEHYGGGSGLLKNEVYSLFPELNS